MANYGGIESNYYFLTLIHFLAIFLTLIYFLTLKSRFFLFPLYYMILFYYLFLSITFYSSSYTKINIFFKIIVFLIPSFPYFYYSLSSLLYLNPLSSLLFFFISTPLSFPSISLLFLYPLSLPMMRVLHVFSIWFSMQFFTLFRIAFYMIVFWVIVGHGYEKRRTPKRSSVFDFGIFRVLMICSICR